MPPDHNENIKILYDVIKDKYDVGSYPEFYQSMKNTQNRSILFDMIKDKYDVGKDVNEFNSNLDAVIAPKQPNGYNVDMNPMGLKQQENSNPSSYNVNTNPMGLQSDSYNHPEKLIETDPNYNYTADINKIRDNKAITNEIMPNEDAKKVKDNYDSSVIQLAEKLGVRKGDLEPVLNDLPKSVNDINAIKQGIRFRETNPNLYERWIGGINYRDVLFNAIKEKDPNNYQNIVRSVFQAEGHPLSNEDNSVNGTQRIERNFSQVEKDDAYLRNLVLKYVDNPDEQKKALQNIATSSAINYSGDIAGTDDALKMMPESQRLNKTELLGLKYLQQFHPEESNFDSLNADVAGMKDGDVKSAALVGQSEQRSKLAQIGIDLKLKTLNEGLDNLISMGAGDSPQGKDYQAQIKAAQTELDKTHNVNDPVYGLSAQFELQNVAQDLSEQKHGFVYHGLRGLASDVMSGVYTILNIPEKLFDSKENNRRIALVAIGGDVMRGSELYLKQSNELMPTHQMVVSPALKGRLDEINGNDDLSDSEKQQQVYDLIKDRKDFYKKPLDGKFNMTASGMAYGVQGAVNGLANFMASMEIGGNLGLSKQLATVGAVIVTGTQHSYINNLKNNVGKPLENAFIDNTISGLAFAAADVPGAIRKLASKTIAADAVAKMSDAELLNVAKKMPTTINGIAKGFATQAIEGVKGTAQMVAAGVGGQIATDAAHQNLKPAEDYGKQALVQGVTFLPLSAVGIFGKINEINKIDGNSWYELASKPNEYMKAADDAVKNGNMSASQAAIVKSNIQKAGEVYSRTNFVDNNNKELSDDAKTKLLLLNIKKEGINDKLKEDNPPKVENDLNEELKNVEQDKNDIYDNKKQIVPEQKDGTAGGLATGGRFAAMKQNKGTSAVDIKNGDSVTLPNGKSGEVAEIKDGQARVTKKTYVGDSVGASINLGWHDINDLQANKPTVVNKPIIESNTKSVLGSTTDLKGNEKPNFIMDEVKPINSKNDVQVTVSNDEPVYDHNGSLITREHEIEIQKAINNGEYQKLVEDGKMTALDAKKVIESAGLEVPAKVEDLAKEELKPKKIATKQNDNALPTVTIGGDKNVSVSKAVIQIGDNIYRGDNHAQAIEEAKKGLGRNEISQAEFDNIDRQRDGKFELSNGEIIDRATAREMFKGVDKSELLIKQDDAAVEADKKYASENKKGGRFAEMKTNEPPTSEQGVADIAIIDKYKGNSAEFQKPGTLQDRLEHIIKKASGFFARTKLVRHTNEDIGANIQDGIYSPSRPLSFTTGWLGKKLFGKNRIYTVAPKGLRNLHLGDLEFRDINNKESESILSRDIKYKLTKSEPNEDGGVNYYMEIIEPTKSDKTNEPPTSEQGVADISGEKSVNVSPNKINEPTVSNVGEVDNYANRLKAINQDKVHSDIDKLKEGDFIQTDGGNGKSQVEGFVKKVGKSKVELETINLAGEPSIEATSIKKEDVKKIYSENKPTEPIQSKIEGKQNDTTDNTTTKEVSNPIQTQGEFFKDKINEERDILNENRKLGKGLNTPTKLEVGDVIEHNSPPKGIQKLVVRGINKNEDGSMTVVYHALGEDKLYERNYNPPTHPHSIKNDIWKMSDAKKYVGIKEDLPKIPENKKIGFLKEQPKERTTNENKETTSTTDNPIQSNEGQQKGQENKGNVPTDINGVGQGDGKVADAGLESVVGSEFDYKGKTFVVKNVESNGVHAKLKDEPNSPMKLVLPIDKFNELTGKDVEAPKPIVISPKDKVESEVIRKAELVKYRPYGGDKAQNGREYIDKNIADGYDKIIKIKRGAVDKYYLDNEKTGLQILISGDVRKYAELALKKISEKAEIKQVNDIPISSEKKKDNNKFSISDKSNDPQVQQAKGIIKKWQDEAGKNNEVLNLDEIKKEAAIYNVKPEIIEQAYHELGAEKESLKNAEGNQKDLTNPIAKRINDFVGKLFGKKGNYIETFKGDENVNGFVDPKTGKIFLNENNLNGNTLVHETGEAWLHWAKENNADVYNAGMEKIVNTKYLSDISKNKFYTDKALEVGKKGSKEYNDYLKNEALAKAIGDKGAQFISEARRKTFIDWAKELFNSIGNALGFKGVTAEELQNMNLDEFSKRAARDILAGEPAEKTGGKEPPKGDPKVEVGNEGNNTVGVSHDSLTSISKKLGLPEPERGEYLPPEWYADRGRKLLEAGADPNEMNNPANELHDRVAIGRAHMEDLIKAADEIARKNVDGVFSDEYKAAAEKANFYGNEIVKKLGTLAHRAMMALQGERDVDTGSFTAVAKSLQDITKKKITEAQTARVKDLVDKNNVLQNKLDETTKKLIDATDKSINEGQPPKKLYKDKAKEVADNFRKLKKKPFSFKDENGVDMPVNIQGLDFNSLIEIGARAIEKTGEIADGIAKIVEKVKDTNWYKGLSDNDKKRFEQQLSDHYESKLTEAEAKENKARQQNISRMEKELADAKEGRLKKKPESRDLSPEEKDIKLKLDDEKLRVQLDGLQRQFAGKSDENFSVEEAKAIWDYAKKAYLDKGISYPDMMSNVKNDLGLTWKQVSSAITTPKAKPISDEMWNTRSKLDRHKIATKDWLDNQNKSMLSKGITKFSGAFRGVAVFGHGGIFVGTHAAPTLFQPRMWKYIVPAFFRGWKFAYGNSAEYERRMEQLKSKQNYSLAQMTGLKNNPERLNGEEYQKSQRYLGKLGGAGERGFNAIKVLRQDMWDYHYERLSDANKDDMETLKEISKIVNLATGATNLNIPKAVNEITFAGGMEAARWGKLVTSPLRASSVALRSLYSAATGRDEVSAADKVFAKVWAGRVGEFLATYSTALLANAAIQNSFNPKNPVNLTNPNQSDFLKFKFGNVTVDPTSGMRGAAMFIYGLGKIPFESKKERKGENVLDAAGKTVFSYGRGKLSPLYATVSDFYTKVDYNKNVMPFSDEKPSSHAHKLTWGEYAWEKAPLPVAEAAHVTYESAIEGGGDKAIVNGLLSGIMSGAISGTTGFRVGEFNLEESKKNRIDDNDPTLKFFSDKGADIPYAKLDVEITSESKAKTPDGKEIDVDQKTAINEMPQEVQDEYIKIHNEEFLNGLKEAKEAPVIYSVKYKDGKGEIKRNVSLEQKNSDDDELKIDALIKEELNQLISVANSKATTAAKDRLIETEVYKNYKKSQNP